MHLTASTLVSAMRGVGDARRAALASLGIITVSDLLRHYPRGYQRRGDVKSLADAAVAAREGMPVSVILTVAAEPTCRLIRRGMSLLRFRAFDESGTCEITYFNQNFLKNTFHTGGVFRFFGRMQVENGRAKMASPIWESAAEGRVLADIVPVYPLASGITQKIMHQLVRDALAALGTSIPETLPPALMQAESLCTRAYALRNIHFPEDGDALSRARRRIAFDEFFETGLAMTALTDKSRTPAPAMADTDVTPLLAQLPYRLTGAQTRSVAEISADLAAGLRMNRILMGDVGSGKTVVAAAAAYIAAKNGYQCALMAPTEILATQHFREMEPLLASLGIRCACLTGALTAAKKRKLHEAIASPIEAIPVVIGTHALLSEGVQFPRLGLVIEDEQHRFGVLQRAALADKSGDAHILVMSATPIPRTLSLVACGGLSVSRLDEMPPGRQTVDTFVVNESYRERLNAFIRRQTDAGHRVYVVCPAVEEEKVRVTDDPEELADLILGAETEEKPPLKAAVEHAEALSVTFPDLGVGYVHGKMKNAEKDRVMQAFSAGALQILVSTTVIEVGVNVPEATLMIVENAERFGLSQLHQLRGRVGRGTAKSYCVLVSDSTAETARGRLDVLRRCHDGQAIAEEDLRLRGPGDLLRSGGMVRQHGASAFSLAATEGGPDVMEAAFRAAREVLERDPALALPEHAGLRDAVRAVRQEAATMMN